MCPGNIKVFEINYSKYPCIFKKHQIICVVYNDLELLANKQAVSLLHSMEQVSRGISLYVNSDKS